MAKGNIEQINERKEERQDIIRNRREILFLYDVKYANPNGDPANNNAPRYDMLTERVLVNSDRIKRTVRDYIARKYEDRENFEIIFKADEKDGVADIKKIFSSHYEGNVDNVKKRCIDARLFGYVLIKNEKKEGDTKDVYKATGPAQVSISYSLNKVELEPIVFSTSLSNRGKDTGGIFTKVVVPYALIATFIKIDHNTALSQNIPLTEEDVKAFLEALWYGTNHLHSTTKFGQASRLLLSIVYKEDKEETIGDLREYISLKPRKEGEVLDEIKIRNASDYIADFSEVLEKIKRNTEIIDKVEIAISTNFHTTPDIVQELKNVLKEDNKVKLLGF